MKLHKVPDLVADVMKLDKSNSQAQTQQRIQALGQRLKSKLGGGGGA